MPITENASIQRYEPGGLARIDDTLVTELNVAIQLHSKELIRATCSPGHLHEWVIGYLLSEGYIAKPGDVAEIEEADGVFGVRLSDLAPTEPREAARLESELIVEPQRVLDIARGVVSQADVFHRTGGTHAMAIATEHEVFAFAEDISRTCALEKALGIALLEGAEFGQCVAFLSSRVPSRMLIKLARCGIPIVAAVSAPTADAVRIAERLNVCLCGFVRDEKMNVYAHGWRLGL
ncbi:formate dehydrogenase accessory sulfurtransferase FdhD [Candidatus Bipolaricaulota bacterium]|nr:formate dehydrogenase accessory sulfurtransferase FdhD [Candidatus Bipolaricaulota bacterium]